MLWGISYASLNLSTLAYAVSDRANAGKRVGASRAAIGVVQAMSLVGGALDRPAGRAAHSVPDLRRPDADLAGCRPRCCRRLPREIADRKPFRLPIPHRLEIWGFTLGFTGDGVFLLTLSFLMKDSITWLAPVLATAILLALRWLVEITTGPLGGWIGDRFGARRISIVERHAAGRGLRPDRARSRAAGRAGHRHGTRGMFNTLIPVLVLERGKSSMLSSQASYSTWRDFGAALGPLSAPWLFLNIPQAPLYGTLAAALGISAYFCLVRR